jgi:WD40 repeat protein
MNRNWVRGNPGAAVLVLAGAVAMLFAVTAESQAQGEKLAREAALTLKGHNGAVWSVYWSPDGKRLASASDDQTMKVWDAATGQVILTLKGHTAPAQGAPTYHHHSVCWSPDGKRLASAGGAPGKLGEVKVWDAASGQEIRTLRHTGPVNSVCWSPDGKRLASAGDDGAVRVWDAERGE